MRRNVEDWVSLRRTIQRLGQSSLQCTRSVHKCSTAISSDFQLPSPGGVTGAPPPLPKWRPASPPIHFGRVCRPDPPSPPPPKRSGPVFTVAGREFLYLIITRGACYARYPSLVEAAKPLVRRRPIIMEVVCGGRTHHSANCLWSLLSCGPQGSGQCKRRLGEGRPRVCMV